MENIPYLSYILLSIFLLFLYIKSDQILSKIASILDRHLKKKKLLERPKRIILVRHGESQANVDCKVHEVIPDNKIELSENGFSQAYEAGIKLKNIIKDGSVFFYVSPLKRTKQTYEGIIKSLTGNNSSMIEDPRLREQEWGNYQESSKIKQIRESRDIVGKFYFRFETGESGADVYDRSSEFMDSMFREIDSNSTTTSMKSKKYENIVLVTHGLTIRLFLMRFYKLSVDQFERMRNPKNTEIIVLEKSDAGKYEIKSDFLQLNRSS